MHCDLNNFYASVECVKNPAYKDVPLAVCGAQEDRHGIVLAKNMLAKGYGIQTGEPTVKAKEKCPHLVLVPTDFPAYVYYSRQVRAIYERYTDYVEPFGMDECWLDVTDAERLFGSGEAIAERIRNEVKKELGLTLSIGVSYNKIFAKLGSDMKKPDAVTLLPPESMKEKIWPLGVGEMLGVGRSTAKKLATVGITTIGKLACTPEKILLSMLGVVGGQLWRYANGLERSAVRHKDLAVPMKSVGRGITCKADLQDKQECYLVLLTLSQWVARTLREEKLMAGGVAVDIKETDLSTCSVQCPLASATQDSLMLARTAFSLLCKKYKGRPIRALTVRAIDLVGEATPAQYDLFHPAKEALRRSTVEDTCDRIRDRYGNSAIHPAALLGEKKLPKSVKKGEITPAFSFGI